MKKTTRVTLVILIGEGNAEGSLLTPDEQVTSVVSQTLETHPDCSLPTKEAREGGTRVTRLCLLFLWMSTCEEISR